MPAIFRMNPKTFPKPPPAVPLALETWLDQVDRSEVGREPFFRGRDAEFDIFRRACGSLHAGRVGGGTMIFQGAPGAGKSALMQECMEAVRRHSTPATPWVAVSMNPHSLRSPVDVIEAMVESANTETGRLREMVSGKPVIGMLDDLLGFGKKFYRELSECGFGAFGLSLGRHHGKDLTARQFFQKAAPFLEKFRIVICVDEAQNTPVSSTTKEVMDCLHRDPQGIPLVVAFFGLSNTQDILRQCDLSRFADERVLNLEPLLKDDAALAIRSVFDAYGLMGKTEDQAAWVECLTELSQGWPQHINRVSVAAARVIRDHNGCIGKDLLGLALEHGRERKNAYYSGRLAAGSRPPWVYREMALTAMEKDGVLSYDDLRQFSTGSRPENFLANALHAGLLAPLKDLPYHYCIPIPSLGDYLQALPVEIPPQD